MTLVDAAALATFGAHDRRLLYAILHVLSNRLPAEDEEPLLERGTNEPLIHWACRCRTPLAIPEQLQHIVEAVMREGAAHLERGSARGLLPIAMDDDRYPPLLRAIPDPPVILWTRGEPAHLLRPAIAVVGSRAATPHGLDIARRIAAGLADAGLVVVSGLARGIDAAAHAASLAAGGATVAVLGCGADRVYPAEHVDLARAIRDAGALVSEFPPGTSPRPHHFPLRNRIISGLAHAVVIVEAPEKSGALITASMAAEQGRDVLVVPGPAVNGRNRGGHLLIRDGAKLVESVDDILQEIGRPVASGAIKSVSNGLVDGQGTSTSLGLNLPDALDFTVDELAQRTGQPPSVILARLLELELSGRIQRIGGGRFVRSAGRVLP